MRQPSSKQAVTNVANSRHDIPLCVQTRVDRADNEICAFRPDLGYCFQSRLTAEHGHESDVFDAPIPERKHQLVRYVLFLAGWLTKKKERKKESYTATLPTCM